MIKTPKPDPNLKKYCKTQPKPDIWQPDPSLNPDRFILMISVLIFGIHPIHVEQNLRLYFTKTLIALKYD